MNKEEFVHKTNIQVRFGEVDMAGVVNNAVYLRYFEHARLEYMKACGLMPPGGIFSDGHLYFIVRNEINYCDFARYDDELIVYTRVSFVKNTSYGFEHVIENAKTGSIIADGKGVIVHVDAKTRKSAPMDESVYEKIKSFDPNVKIIRED